MVQTSYSNGRLLKVAKKNYSKLKEFCKVLEEEGYWIQPEQILKRSIVDVLDIYVQSVLVNLSVYCGRFQYDEREFIISLPSNNIIGCNLEGDMDESFFANANRVIHTPPIILQLCGVRDVDKNSNFTVDFFDAFMNILLCMANLNSAKDTLVTSFVQDYYRKISVFVNQRTLKEVITPRYIFKKLSTDTGFEEISVIKKKNEFCDNVAMIKEQLEEKQIQELKQEIAIRTKQGVLEQLLEELYELIGLEGVKEEINSLINLIKVKKLRESYGMPSMDISYHMVFTGNPGTGKTTVARLVAKIYKELGVLTEGNLVEVDRSGLVAGYVGQTALKVKDVVERAVGGVLFIDEAYALVNDGVSNDFGKEAIDTLVKMMEDHRDNLVVIVAGYRKEMESFLASNSGLISRFNKFIEFCDYSIEELMKILDLMIGKAGLYMETEARQEVEGQITQMKAHTAKVFGNGRGVRNVFEKIIVNQANRIITQGETSKEHVATIEKSDIYNIFKNRE